MQLPHRSRSPAPEDLTARARIRDAALQLFAERGASGTTIRSIAEAAGVSPALVQHHFGSKEQLRAACDAYVVQVLRELKGPQALREGKVFQPGFLALLYQASMPVMRYLARALVDGSPAAAALFDQLVAFTEEILARDDLPMLTLQTEDRHACAAALTAMQLGLLALHSHLSRALGADVLTSGGIPRLHRALVDIYAHGIINPEFAAKFCEILDAYQASLTPPTSPTKGPDNDRSHPYRRVGENVRHDPRAGRAEPDRPQR